LDMGDDGLGAGIDYLESFTSDGIYEFATDV
jgi:hypothetical protein